MPGIEREQPDLTPTRRRVVENNPTTTEERAQARLWRIAGIGTTAQNMIQIERAWQARDDESVLDVIDNWGWDRDPFLETLFLDLADEDEERGWRLYRTWFRQKIDEDPTWYAEKVRHARERLELHEQLRAGIKEDRYVQLRIQQSRIMIEEWESFTREQ